MATKTKQTKMNQTNKKIECDCVCSVVRVSKPKREDEENGADQNQQFGICIANWCCYFEHVFIFFFFCILLSIKIRF